IPRIRSAPSLHVPPESLLDLAAGIPLREVVPLVVGLLALRQRKGGLDLAVLEVQVERDEREPALLDLADQLVDLGPVHEHLPLAPRGVVGPRALHVLRDVHVLEPHLAVVDRGEPVDERGAAGTKALHLGAGQREADLVGVEDRVVVPRLLVLGDELAPGLTRHVSRLPAGCQRPRPAKARRYSRTYSRSVTYEARPARPTPAAVMTAPVDAIWLQSMPVMIPALMGPARVWSTNSTLVSTSPTTASSPPIRPATAASRMNGSWVYQREAPTNRMMLVSLRRLNAASWIVFEMSSSAANAWTTATAIVAFRAPLSRLNSLSRKSPSSLTWSTPF